MAHEELEIFSNDELWDMKQEVTAILKTKLEARMKVIDHRLARLNGRLRGKQTSKTLEL